MIIYYEKTKRRFKILILKFLKYKESMNIKIEASYFSLKCKPSLLHPLNMSEIRNKIDTGFCQPDWQFRSLEQFQKVNQIAQQMKQNISTLVKSNGLNRLQGQQVQKVNSNQVDQTLKKIKLFFEKCQHHNITLVLDGFLMGDSSLLNLYHFPQSYNTCALLIQMQRSLKSISSSKDFQQIQNKFPFMSILQKVTVRQISTILKFLKDNLYIPNTQLFEVLLQKLDFRYDETFSFFENMQQNKLDLSDIRNIQTYYYLLVYKDCSSLKGLCHYLSFAKNLLLDRKNGALSTDHETWVMIYETCLRLYARNSQVRENHWLDIDQILSTAYADQEFTNFLLTQNVENFSLVSLNFYMKNLNKSEQERLLLVVQQKIVSIFDQGLAWKQAEDIIEHLNNECPSETKENIFTRVISFVDEILTTDNDLHLQKDELNDIEMGLVFFIESMCKNILITKKIFNKTTMKLIIQVLKKSPQNQQQIRLVHLIFTEFVINSFDESDQLSSYLQENQEIILELIPEIITLFNTHNYTLPKQLYKLIFHSASDIDNLSPKIWRGIAELYFTQSFEQSIDMETFHTQNQAKKRIADQVVQLLKELTINNAKQHNIISSSLQTNNNSTKDLTTFLFLKSFKDQLIFNNILMMSTYFGQHLPLSQLSSIFPQFYTPLVPDIKWKSSQTQNLTILSFLCEEFPIDVLKATYKFLQQGYAVNAKDLNKLQLGFWNGYLDSQPQAKVKAILNEQDLTYQSYQNLQQLRMLDLVLNMINCVFQKLNDHSQRSIKQLRIMYEWGIQYIQQLQPYIYPLLIDCMSTKFILYSKELNSQNIQSFQIYNRAKNISVLDLHLCEKYHAYQTFSDFNRIGKVIEHQKELEMEVLMYPCFLKKSKKILGETLEKQFLKVVLRVFVLMQNSCLQQVMNDGHLSKVSTMHVQSQRYYQKAIQLLQQLNQLLTNHKQTQQLHYILQQPLYKRLISHLKLLMGKIYIPTIVKLAFRQQQDNPKQTQVKKMKSLDLKYGIIKTAVEIIYKFDPLFQQHFAELMQVVEEHAEIGEKRHSEEESLLISQEILLRTLQMFIECVLGNIKVRSFHIFKLIKLYLSKTHTEIQHINQVIKFYIDLFLNQFIQKDQYQCFNEQVKQRCKYVFLNNNQTSRIKILAPHKSKQHLSTMGDKMLSPVKRERVSLQEFRMKMFQKLSLTPHKQGKQKENLELETEFRGSQQPFSQQIPQQFKKLIISKHNLNTIQSSCTLSMFINLFARLNFSSLPTGIEAMLSKQNDKIVYMDYLMELTHKLNQKEFSDTISPRDMEILSIDVYGNLACILKGKVNQSILRKFVQLAKANLELRLPQQTVASLPIRLLNQRLFHKPTRKIASSDPNLNQLTQISKLISQFEQEPLAFDLSVKSHLMKITPYIKSNLHICNLQYIVGDGKSSVSKKVLETNHKLIESILEKNAYKELLKKYDKPIVKKQTLQTYMSSSAVEEIDKILVKFAQLYETLATSSEEKIIRFYFYFKKICSLVFYAPELFPHILTKSLRINHKQMTFTDIMFDSLKETLVLFCEFYMLSLKINAGFCSGDQLRNVILSISAQIMSKIEEKIENLSGGIPLNLVFEVFIKLRLLNLVKQNSDQNLNALRVLNFAIKQSQKFRFRFYKFIKINIVQHEELLKKVDDEILEALLKQLQDCNNHNNNVKRLSVISKVQVMNLCLENILSHTMVDYAKMRLDSRLKETFSTSQYSIKCLQSVSNDIHTLKVLEEDQQEKSISSSDGLQLQQVESNTIIQNQPLVKKIQKAETNNISTRELFQTLQVVRTLSSGNKPTQFLKTKPHTEIFTIIQLSSELQSTKQTDELKQWLGFSLKKSQQSTTITNVLLRQMQRSCDKMVDKENLSFNFEDAVYLDPQHTDQLQITAFAISENSNMSSDCCIDQTSLAQIPIQGSGVGSIIMHSLQSIDEQIKENQPHDDIRQQSSNSSDGIIQQQGDQGIQNTNQYDVKISIVEQTHVNRFKCYENQRGDSIVEMVDEKMGEEEQEEYQQQQMQQAEQPSRGTDGSIQFTSIKTLGVLEQVQIQPISQQLIPQQLLTSQTIISNQQRQFHYTIDNFTTQTSNQRINNASLIDQLETQAINSNQPVTKESIFTLIEEYTLNPQILKIIILKLKKISNSELKKVQPITYGDLKQQVEKEMRCRGIYIALSSNQYEPSTEGSLFSINKLINQSFQIDQSKFYAANFKRCDKKTQQKQKIEKIPVLTFNEWTHFVLIYVTKTRENKVQYNTGINILLQAKSMNQLLLKLLLSKQNLLTFLQVLLNLLFLQKNEEIIQFLESHTGLSLGLKDYKEILHDLDRVLLNDLVAKLIINRIGLPVIFKGKWNYQAKKLIKYEYSCLASDSNLSANRSQGQPLLQVFLRKSIQLIHTQQQKSPSSQKPPSHPQQTFVKSLTDYFKSVQNFQTNQYPYYKIQDTIKLSTNQKKNSESLSAISYGTKQFVNDRVRANLCQVMLNAMKTSKVQTLKQYQEVFYLMNYLDFATFSEFLQLLIQRHKPLCQKILDRELNIIKRFKKSGYSTTLSQQKLAQLYWHMRKSSKSFLSTDHEQKDLQFFAKLISLYSSSIFQKFKESTFSYGYGKEENKRKQKISYLGKLLMNPTYESQYRAIREEITELQREYLLWKLSKSTEIMKEDILPIIEKISLSFGDCLKKWETLFLDLEEVFGIERQEKFILYKQCSQFYKIFLSFEMLMQEEESNIIRTMSSLKTKPLLESTRQMGLTGRLRSNRKLPKAPLTSSLCLSTPQIPTFKSVFKKISPRFGFFSQMLDSSCLQLRIHAKYSTLESKLKLLHQKSKSGQITIEVKRDNIWQDTLPYLNEEIADKNVKIKFYDQLGLDYGGIRREWITLIVKQLLNPNLGLFELSVNGLAFQPSALSFLVPNHLYHFYKLGILVGKALKENWLLEINFTKSFLKHILGYTLYVQDLEDIDPSTAKSLLWILNNDVGDGDLGIDFTYEFDILGKKQCVELMENGKQVTVSEDNKKDYVKKLATYKMTEQIRDQAKAFMNGLEKVVSFETLKLFSYKDLGIYLAGMPTVDVEEMKKYTRYQGFSPQDQTVVWFWETLPIYTEEQKANFLFFLTGSYKVPYGGFKQNPITINKMPASTDYLPVAHTCFSVIDLPQYTSKQKLSMLLDTAIKEGKGFSVS